MNKPIVYYYNAPLLLPMVFLIIVLQIMACQQPQIWKKPTPVAISMNIKSQDTNGSGYLEFTQGQITLSKIAVEGNLNNADDFRFERNFPSGLVVNFNDTVTLEQLTFDLPQGDYTELKVHFETIASSLNIFVAGIYDYNNPNKADAIVNFEVDSLLAFDIVVVSPQGSQNVHISDITNNDIEILMSPPHWFKNTTALMMNNANTTIVGSQSYITINRLSNTNIYQSAKARIGGDILSTLN